MWRYKWSVFLLLPIFLAIKGNVLERSQDDDSGDYEYKKTEQEETRVVDTITQENLRKTYEVFLKQGEDYAGKLKLECAWMKSETTGFIRDLENYFNKLPKEETKMVIKKTRARCYCDGDWKSPCPDECIHSCYLDNNNYDDCEKLLERNSGVCYCDHKSNKRCDQGMHLCYEQETITEIYKPPCIELAINKTMFIESFKIFAHLMIEPQERLYRDVYFKLNKLKKNLFASGLLFNMTNQLCRDTNFPEAKTLLAKQAESVHEYVKNMTLYLINSQNVRNDVNKNLHDFKEQSLNQINTAIKNYGCCLNGIKFNVTNNECKESQNAISTNTSIPKTRISLDQEDDEGLRDIPREFLDTDW